MKRVIALLLALCIAAGLFGCGAEQAATEPPTQPAKSEQAKRADALILAIGEVTADSEAAIKDAQAYYDSLTQEQKSEVENYSILENAQKLLPEILLKAKEDKVKELIADGSYIEASILLSELTELEKYAELMSQCGSGVLFEYVKTNGKKNDEGNYYLVLKESTDDVQLAAMYMPETNTIQFSNYSVFGASYDVLILNLVYGEASATFARSVVQYGTPTNYQEGIIQLNQYTGKYSGSLADNSDELLVIHGLTETKVQTIYSEQTKGFKLATMTSINELLDAIFTEIQEAGFTGTISDIGFVTYKAEE